MIELNVTNLVGGNIVITSPQQGIPRGEPLACYVYDENGFITGMFQGSPNVLLTVTYTDYSDEEYAEAHDGEYPEKQGSAYVYSNQNRNIYDTYALGIEAGCLSNTDYYDEMTAPNNSPYSINFPNVVIIPSYAFYGCNLLTTVTLQNVTSIRNGAFVCCDSLTNITIGSHIQTIGEFAFEGYGQKKTITIGKSVAEVEAMGQTDYNHATNVPYSEWGLSSGSTIVCTNGTILIRE